MDKSARAVGAAGVVALLLFFYSECKNDARRIIFLTRVNHIEECFFRPEIYELESELKMNKNALSDSFPTFDNETLTNDPKKAVRIAARSHVRLFTYVLLTATIVVLSLFVLFHII
jgi:hypothetical protein